MKHKIILVVVISLIVTAFSADIASAHILKTDGTIGAVLHISPDDNPISGKPNDYIFAFQDTAGHFQLSNCLCAIAFVKDDTTLKQMEVTATSPLTSKNDFAFSSPGVYTVRISGTPKQTGGFQAFTLNYTIRVSNDGLSANEDFPPTLWVGIGLAMALVILATVPAMYNDSKTISASREKK